MNKPVVGILMGSDSDLSIMKEAADVLDQFGIGCEVHTLSAHRTPAVVIDYVQKSEASGYKAFICGAGGAAHLAGVVAAHTALPVIGVPLISKTMGAAGLDALYSTVQMPPGVPVATVAINGAKNAGILAAQIIGAGDDAVRKSVVAYKEKMAKDIAAKDAKLQEKGVKKYLEEQAA
ncbi:MAG: hypothetical protein RIQ56_49 [Candidatus Parcubacteria bacterium]|jgi:5-(carboxyamino)imidazole ribonucleotide mutase